jgi:hypothetical protein
MSSEQTLLETCVEVDRCVCDNRRSKIDETESGMRVSYGIKIKIIALNPIKNMLLLWNEEISGLLNEMYRKKGNFLHLPSSILLTHVIFRLSFPYCSGLVSVCS